MTTQGGIKHIVRTLCDKQSDRAKRGDLLFVQLICELLLCFLFLYNPHLLLENKNTILYPLPLKPRPIIIIIIIYRLSLDGASTYMTRCMGTLYIYTLYTLCDLFDSMGMITNKSALLEIYILFDLSGNWFFSSLTKSVGNQH